MDNNSNSNLTNQTIFGTIRQEINDFVNNYIEVVPGFNFNQYETIKRIHLYTNSRFYDQSLFSGREKLFFNISNYRKQAVSTYLNIDTGDIRIYPMNPKSDWSVFFLEKELKLWLKNNHIPKKLNEMAEEGAGYGSVVIKKTPKGAQIVDLRRLFLDPTVRRIKDSRFVTIKHYMTPSELRAKVKDGWDKTAIEAIILKKKGQKSFAPQSYENYGVKNPIVSTPYIEVYERYGELDASFFAKRGDPLRCLAIIAEPFLMGRDQAGTSYDEGNILYKSEWKKDWPFNDYHYQQTRGRWLGVGVVEELFPAQERFNELSNQKRIAMEISAMHLFQTADATVVDNILTDLQSGDLLKTKTQGAIAPIANEERNLEAFESEEKSYTELADKISFVNDLIAGGQIASSTPATTSAIQNTNAKSLLKFKRENFAIFIREFIDEFVLPQVIKDITPAHILRFTGDYNDLSKLDDAYTTVLCNNAVFDHVIKTGHVPTQDEYNALKQKTMMKMKGKGSDRFVDMPQAFYGDSEFEFDVILDEEQEPIAALANNTFQLLTAIGQNPILLSNPITKALIYSWAQKVGISPVKLEIAEASAPPQVQQPQQNQQQSSMQPNQSQAVSPQPSPFQQQPMQVGK